MLKRVHALVLAVIAALVAAGVVSGRPTATITYALTAKMNARQVVPPLQGALPAGQATLVGTLQDRSTARGHIFWTLRFSKLTSRATHTYIYVGKPGSVGKLAVILCSPCRTVSRGDAYVSRTVVKALASGSAYVQTETVKHRAGEIRGQISAHRK